MDCHGKKKEEKGKCWVQMCHTSHDVIGLKTLHKLLTIARLGYNEAVMANSLRWSHSKIRHAPLK